MKTPPPTRVVTTRPAPRRPRPPAPRVRLTGQKLVKSYRARLAAGFRAWKKARRANRNTYYYSRRRSRMWGSYKTLIGIRRGKPYLRAYLKRVRRSPASGKFIERGAKVGRSDSGDNPRTIEQIYAACRSMLKRVGNARRIRSSGLEIRPSDGVITACYVVRSSCADDCSKSSSVSDFHFGPVPADALKSFR